MKNISSFNTPILFILFNRPDLAAQTLERIRLVAPSFLYIAVDGPRADNIDDIVNVKACRELIDTIDWPCEVRTLIRGENLGCKKAVSSAITWFFEQVDAGIILEDDCLPDLTFFDFCYDMLQKYANEPKIMHISGANLYQDHKWGEYTYFFSSIAHIWGWATWRRAWRHYNVNMEGYEEFKQNNLLNKIVTYKPSISYWKKIFDDTRSGKINTWDYQWVYTIWRHEGLSITPNQNLVSNIGFGKSATHTLGDSNFANLPTIPVDIERIKHPLVLTANKSAVNYAFAKYYSAPSRLSKLKALFLWKNILK